jgi:hypothetical protein
MGQEQVAQGDTHCFDCHSTRRCVLLPHPARVAARPALRPDGAPPCGDPHPGPRRAAACRAVAAAVAAHQDGVGAVAGVSSVHI